MGDSFLIVTEGEVTEKLYFEGVRNALQISPVTVEVVHPHCTDAVGLVQAAIDLCEKDSKGNRCLKKSAGTEEIKILDHVWVLFDTDVCCRQNQFDNALQLAQRHKIHIGHSTPCSELWLLLHFRDRPGPFLASKDAQQALSAVLGSDYNKSAETFREKLWPALKPKISEAVFRGNQTRQFHQTAGTSHPANPSTELDLLVRALNNSVRAELRILV